MAGREAARGQRAEVRESRMTRDEIIGRLVEKFGPHPLPEPPDGIDGPLYPGERRYAVPDEDQSTMTVFLDTDGYNSMRPLTYGEIADALCDPA